MVYKMQLLGVHGQGNATSCSRAVTSVAKGTSATTSGTGWGTAAGGTGSRNRNRAGNLLRAPHAHQGSRPAFPGTLWEHFQGKHSHGQGANHGDSRENHKPQIPRQEGSRDVGRQPGLCGTGVTSASVPGHPGKQPGGNHSLGTHIWLPLAKVCGKISHVEVQPAGHAFPRRSGPQLAPQAGPEQGLCH